MFCNCCGKEISDRAAACPNCGCPINCVDTVSKPNYAQIRVLLKAPKITVGGQATKQGSVVKVTVNSSGSCNVLMTAWGGDVGALGSSLSSTVYAGHKYDLSVHMTFRGRMLYLTEVDSFT